MDYSDALQVVVATDGARVRRQDWPEGDWLTCTACGAVSTYDLPAVNTHAPEAVPPYGVLSGRVFIRFSQAKNKLSFWMPLIDDVTTRDWVLVE
jgi:hypothetical protein